MMNRERGDFVTTNKGTENISILKTLLLIFIPT